MINDSINEAENEKQITKIRHKQTQGQTWKKLYKIKNMSQYKITNQWTGFYIMGTSAIKELRKNFIFFGCVIPEIYSFENILLNEKLQMKF